MKTTNRLISTVCGVACAAAMMTQAADASAQESQIGADLALAVPLGDWGDVAGIGGGVLGSYQYNIDGQLGITGRLGFIIHAEKEAFGMTTSSMEIPIYGGVKYRFSEEINSLYGAGELGLTMLSSESCGTLDFGLGTPAQDFCVDSSDTKLGMTLGAGYDLDKLDFRGALWFPSVGDAGDIMGLLVTVGYKFASF